MNSTANTPNEGLQTTQGLKLAVGLGSNLGDRLDHLDRAAQWLENLISPPIAASSVWETEPWGYAGSSWHYNQVMLFKSDLEPARILEILLGIERQMGRDRREEACVADRLIDLDLLCVESRVRDAAGPGDLVLPHPRMHLRKFVLVPLAECWPGWVHPVLQLDLQGLLTQCGDHSALHRVEIASPQPDWIR